MRSPRRLWRELWPRQLCAFQPHIRFLRADGPAEPRLLGTDLYLPDSGSAYISALFPAAMLYIGVFSMLADNLLMVYSMMAGCMDRGLYGAMRMIAIPLYWALMSVAR
jgi:hypothetical protein